MTKKPFKYKIEGQKRLSATLTKIEKGIIGDTKKEMTSLLIKMDGDIKKPFNRAVDRGSFTVNEDTKRLQPESLPKLTRAY